MADEREADGLGCESGGVAAEVSQPKGAASKKKNKWKTVTAEFYQPKPYEADQGKGKAGGLAKGPAGKGGSTRVGEDFGAKGGRGNQGSGTQQDEGRLSKPIPDEIAKQPPLETLLAESDAPGARGGSGDVSPKRKPLGNKPRDAKGKGKSKQAGARKGMGFAQFDGSRDVDGPPLSATIQQQQQRAGLVLKGGQSAMGLGQHPVLVQQMTQQGAAVQQQFVSFGGPGPGVGSGGMVYQNAQAMPSMYAMPYYVPVQMAQAQMPAIYTTSPAFMSAGGQPSGCATGAPTVPGAAVGIGPKLQQASSVEGDRAALKDQVQQQIEYYFDGENLVKDMYLRRSMTDEGWVAVWLIAGFRRVQSMTMDMALVVEAIQTSSKLELDIQKQFVRPKDGWQQWVIGSSGAAAPQHEMPGGDMSGSIDAP